MIYLIYLILIGAGAIVLYYFIAMMISLSKQATILNNIVEELKKLNNK